MLDPTIMTQIVDSNQPETTYLGQYGKGSEDGGL